MSKVPTEREKLLDTLWRYKAFYSPEALEVGKVEEKDLARLQPHDKVVRAALRAYQGMMAVAFARISNEVHGRPAIHDGEFGPASKLLLEEKRCGHPDFPDPDVPRAALGVNGNWKSCHGVGDFHCAIIRIAKAPPSHWLPLWPQIQALVTAAYGQMGEKLLWTGEGSSLQTAPAGAKHNIETSWVSRSAGWIGYAQVGLGLSCGETFWQQYLGTYLESSANDARKLRLLTVLFMHETGHNHGCEHTRGGVMNPSILDVQPTWIGDTSEAFLRRHYGGVPVPGPTPGPEPQPPGGVVITGELNLKQGDTNLGSYILIPKIFRNLTMASSHIEELSTRVAQKVAVEPGTAVPADAASADPPVLPMDATVWITLIIQIAQLVMENLDGCQAKSGLFSAVKRPGILARAVNRARANQIFRNGDPALTRLGGAVAAALETETAQLSDDEIEAVINEVDNPNTYILI